MVTEPLGPCAPSAFFCSFDSFTRMIGKNHQTLLELNWSQYTYYIFIVHHFLTSRPYHCPHPLARFTYHFDQVRVVWPSVSRYFHFQEKLHPIRQVTGVMYALSYWYCISLEVRKTLRIHEQNFLDKFSNNSEISDFQNSE